VLFYVHRDCHDYVQITPKSWAYTGEKGKAPKEPTAQQLSHTDFRLLTTAWNDARLQMPMEPCYASAVLIRELNLPGPRNVNNKLSQIISSVELSILESENPLRY